MKWMLTYDLVLFDVDGTLVTTKSRERHRKTPDDWELMPGREQAIADLHEAGKLMALVTNQGGAAFGYFSSVEMRTEIARLADLLHLRTTRRAGLRWEGYYICFTHPDGTVPALARPDERRKPGPGMLQEAMRESGIAPRWTLMVGDRVEDKHAADAAGTGFMWSQEFFAPYSVEARYGAKHEKGETTNG